MWSRALRFIRGARVRRLAPFFLLAAALAVGYQMWGDYPRETELLLWLGAGSGSVVEVGISFFQDGESMQGVRLRFPAGAPRRLPYRTQLAPGHYRVDVELCRGDGRTIHAERRLQIPAEGAVRIDTGLADAR